MKKEENNCHKTELSLEGVLGVPPGHSLIWGLSKEDSKKNGQSITISTPRFGNLTTALYDYFMNCQPKKIVRMIYLNKAIKTNLEKSNLMPLTMCDTKNLKVKITKMLKVMLKC